MVDPMHVSCIHLKAPNTPSGNPRRLYAMVDPLEGMVAVVDEEYSGTQAIVQDLGAEFATLRPFLELDIQPKVYADLLKRFGPGGPNRKV